MSSPIRDDGDLDPILRYAPPQVREQGQPPRKPPAPPLDRPGRRQSADSPEIYGDRAMVEMRHRLTLDPEWIPEPPEYVAPAAAAQQPNSAGDQASLAKFKEFMAQQGRTKLSQEELAKLYAQFQEWNCRSKN